MAYQQETLRSAGVRLLVTSGSITIGLLRSLGLGLGNGAICS
jgi:hypothetical protein